MIWLAFMKALLFVGLAFSTYVLNEKICDKNDSNVQVWSATYNRNSYAIKLYAETYKTKDEFNREVEIASLFHHPNIIRLIDAGTFTNCTLKYYIAFELAEKDLRHYTFENIKMFKTLAIHLLRGLKHMKSKGVVHCDIKLDNIVVSNDEFKIIDFGCARMFKKDSNLHFNFDMGAHLFPHIAPEILNDQDFNYKADVFSVGFLLNKIWSESEEYFRFEMTNEEVQSFQMFCHKLLENSVENRYDADEALLDPWLDDMFPMVNLDLYQNSSFYYKEDLFVRKEDGILSILIFSTNETLKIIVKKDKIKGCNCFFTDVFLNGDYVHIRTLEEIYINYLNLVINKIIIKEQCDLDIVTKS